LEGLKSGLRWVEVKRLLEASTGKKINDRFVTKYLDELKNMASSSNRMRSIF